MNGTRMWKPALSVPENLPRRSTTHACCCGTTRAIREMRIIAKITITSATIKVPIRVLLGSCANVQRQTDHTVDDTLLPARERRGADVPRAPGRAAHLRAAVRLRGHVLQRDSVLAGDRIDVG